MLRWTTVGLAAALAACGGASSHPPKLRATASQGDLTVELWSVGPLTAGLNHLAYQVTQAGAAVTAADISQRPLMTMPGLEHGAPQVAPGSTAGADGRFEGIVVFTMPSSDTEKWSLALDVTPQGGTTRTVVFDGLDVALSTSVVSSMVGGTPYIYSLSFPYGAPSVGANTATVSVHTPHDASEATYDAVEGLTVTLTPDMPSMGHGSSGNVQPAAAGNGLYEGTLNFSMAGDWVVHLKLEDSAGATLLTRDFAFSL